MRKQDKKRGTKGITKGKDTEDKKNLDKKDEVFVFKFN